MRPPEARRHLGEEIAGLWRTDPIRPHRPEPLDEVRAVLALFDQTIFTTLPLVYRDVDRALDPASSGARRPTFEPFLSWGTWVGGDRDGNPSVTAEVTLAALAIQSEHVLRGLERTARRIARSLSVSEIDVPPSRALRTSLARDGRDLPSVAADLERKLPDAPHRRKLVLTAERLAATRTGGGGAYLTPAGFASDLAVLQSSWTTGGARASPSASSSTCGGRSRRSGSTWRPWRCVSMRTCTLASWRSSRPVRRATLGRSMPSRRTDRAPTSSRGPRMRARSWRPFARSRRSRPATASTPASA